ncbi:MAG: thioesterase family protein [Sphingomonadaceae bacterium]|nr:thioesterase family protein [Sphingomonadaceae bacterium]
MFDVPFCDYRIRVPAEWVDENDHMDSMEYKRAADGGTRVLLGHAGITSEAIAQAGSTLFQLEMHIVFERELRLGDPVVVRSWLIGADAKRIHHFHEIVHEEAGYRAATVELMTIHVDRATRRSALMPAAWSERLQAIAAAHGAVPPPDKVGRRIGLQRHLTT